MQLTVLSVTWVQIQDSGLVVLHILQYLTTFLLGVNSTQGVPPFSSSETSLEF